MNQKQQIIKIYLKNNQTNFAEVTSQTKNIRNDTNQKIRQLGNKYYSIKAIFEQLNLKRDDLFKVGKELEEEFREIKIGIHLQNQKRRMKEALYCWYAENFFSEIVLQNPSVMNKLYQISNDHKITKIVKVKSQSQSQPKNKACKKTQSNDAYMKTDKKIQQSSINVDNIISSIDKYQKEIECDNSVPYIDISTKIDQKEIFDENDKTHFCNTVSFINEGRKNDEIDSFDFPNNSVSDNFNFTEFLTFK
ncbi:hypothetical protein M9Y10_024551 [Tritrichomonas musculus]|uniref:Uncharacterized protein n=1 Tax=Tritrichomonas musculus TaxID=1915356 RepID=A0ABR2HCA9_9EUKA